MKRNNRGFVLFGLFFLFGIFLVNFVSAESCDLSVSLVNQDPYPAIPGEYVDVVFQVDGIENPSCEGAVFELITSYPFSLDGDDALRILEGSTYVSGYKSEWMIPYQVRVDANALDGNSTLTVNYGQETTLIARDFYIVIQDSRTAFDAVIQESTDSDVSIAIANIGKYVANSVVVRIPEQDGFKATETDGQMVGNLDAGDYTIVSFSITSMVQRSSQKSDSDVNVEDAKLNLQDQESNLQFDIYYTDALGERRIANMELPLKMTSTLLTEDGEMPEGFSGRNMKTNESSWSNWYTLIIILLLAGGILFLYKKYPEQIREFYVKSKQKIKGIFNKNKQNNNTSTAIPDWINNDKNKEKKK